MKISKSTWISCVFLLLSISPLIYEIHKLLSGFSQNLWTVIVIPYSVILIAVYAFIREKNDINLSELSLPFVTIFAIIAIVGMVFMNVPAGVLMAFNILIAITLLGLSAQAAVIGFLSDGFNKSRLLMTVLLIFMSWGICNIEIIKQTLLNNFVGISFVNTGIPNITQVKSYKVLPYINGSTAKAKLCRIDTMAFYVERVPFSMKVNDGFDVVSGSKITIDEITPAEIQVTGVQYPELALAHLQGKDDNKFRLEVSIKNIEETGEAVDMKLNVGNRVYSELVSKYNNYHVCMSGK